MRAIQSYLPDPMHYEIHRIYSGKGFIILEERPGRDVVVISNARMISSPKWAELIMGNVFYPPIHGLMSRAQLKNIKKLSERDAQARRELHIPRPMHLTEPLVNN